MTRRRRLGTAIAAAAVLLASAGSAAFAAMGDLDSGFSGDGKLIQEIGPGNSSASASEVVTDSQNRILVAGDFDPPAVGDPRDVAVARYLPNGTLDTSFGGGDGIYTQDIGGILDDDSAESIALDSQGRIAIGGGSREGADQRAAIVRLTTSGAADPAFGGGDGIFIQDLSAADSDFVNDIAFDSSGRIVGTGEIGPGATTNALIVRLTAAGAIDTGFSAPDGFESVNINSVGSDDEADGIALDSSGRIVIAGQTDIAIGQENFFAARFLANGALDASFSSNPAILPGRSIVDTSSGTAPNESDGAIAVAIAGGDRPVLAGDAELTGTTDDAAVLRMTPAGARDASFSGDGAAYVDFGASDNVRNLALDGSGRIVVAGSSSPAGPDLFALARFLPTGSLDASFSGDGKVTTDIGPVNDVAQGVAVDRGGRIVAAGFTGGLGVDWAIARYEGVPRCAGKIPTLTGTPGKDKLKGTKGKDVISGGDGKDTISGLAKADTLCGENGKDKLSGGKGNDRLVGGKGNDTLTGGQGKDKLKGGKGKDKQRQ